ncbi:unnamed protein product [Cuscuta campestris]|uniref:Mei2-like C-terminal RNA recognition motif domain-containing protein n=1 Tax=Cuscuta campestris TaxID=132261 RepID=A0A484KS61_9ASTE|nr:unnamed protein product [Cuscuta campestris]
MSKLNPAAKEYFPVTSRPYMPNILHRNLGCPPQAAARTAHGFCTPRTVGVIQRTPCFGYFTGGVVAVRKEAARAFSKKKKNLKAFVLPPRLQEKLRNLDISGKVEGKIWRPVKASGRATGGVVDESLSPATGKTTVMIKNVPNQYRRDSFMAFIDKHCAESHLSYDFLYLPIDFKTKNNVGYAFVNFTTAAGAAKIRELLRFYQWGEVKIGSGIFNSRKICEITWARIQGKEELVKHFEKSNFICGTADYLPVAFSPPRNGMPGGSWHACIPRQEVRPSAPLPWARLGALGIQRVSHTATRGGDSAISRKKWTSGISINKVIVPHQPEDKKLKIEPITFSNADLTETWVPHPYGVITIDIMDLLIHKTLVDMGSSMNIMYMDTFKALGLTQE